MPSFVIASPDLSGRSNLFSRRSLDSPIMLLFVALLGLLRTNFCFAKIGCPARTRTWKPRPKFSCVTNYTTGQYLSLLHLLCLVGLQDLFLNIVPALNSYRMRNVFMLLLPCVVLGLWCSRLCRSCRNG